MKLTELFLSELDREVPRSRRALGASPGADDGVLMDAKVPSIYGPSADDTTFA